MATLRKLLFPQPGLSLFLLLLWLLLMNSIAPAQVLLGALLAWFIPLSAHQYWPERARFRRPWLLLRYLGVVLWDILLANINVARLILGPKDRLHPAMVEVPLDLRDPFALTILSNTITLSPGTVSMSLSNDHRVLMIHALNVDDTEAMVREIKERYEAALMEIFEC